MICGGWLHWIVWPFTANDIRLSAKAKDEDDNENSMPTRMLINT
jgi:hypothetical protein